MSALDVPGTALYYETHGDGPPLIMIPGASGVSGSFRMVAAHLAGHYTVTLYDRRGFSRSRLDGAAGLREPVANRSRLRAPTHRARQR